MAGNRADAKTFMQQAASPMVEHLSDRIEWRNNARSASAAEHPVHRLTTLTQ